MLNGRLLQRVSTTLRSKRRGSMSVPALMGPMGLVFASLGGVAASPRTEAELVQLYLDGPVGVAERMALEARSEAAQTAPALANPELEVRHEEARGPAGATTDALGGSIALGLGLLAERRAADLRGEAAERWTEAAVMQSICDVRRDSTELWAASRRASAVDESQGRLEQLASVLRQLAEAGEAAGYDRDLAALSVTVHSLERTETAGAVDALRTQLSALTGEIVDEVQLAETPPLPTLPVVEERLVAHPELKALRLEQLAAERSVVAARRAALPELRVFGGARWDAPVGGTATPGMELGGALEVPLFDWARQEVRHLDAQRAKSTADHLRREADLRAAIQSAWGRAAVLSELSEPPDPGEMWEASVTRYTAGESSLEDLLQVAESVEQATVFGLERERRFRQARIDLACASGRFDEPSIQNVFEGSLR